MITTCEDKDFCNVVEYQRQVIFKLRQELTELKEKNQQMYDLNQYQDQATCTALYPNKGNNYIYPVLGLCGESGEVAEKIKKIIRDNGGVISEEKKTEIIKELGDVLWYISALCTELNTTINHVAETNITKLFDRKKRDTIHGSGDNR